MLPKTHIAIAVLIILFFIPHIQEGKVFFVAILLIASLLPDIDNGFSNFRKLGPLRVLSFLKNHRGVFHSFSFCILVSVFFAFFFPNFALPFFLGYSSHLIADSWTVEGIKPFWPWKKTLNGHVRDGSVVEHSVFAIFAVLDIVVLLVTIL